MKRLLLYLLTLTTLLVAAPAPAAESPAAHAAGFRFVQLCDPQLGISELAEEVQAFRTAMNQINALRPDFVLICGDLVQTSSNPQEIQAFLQIRAGFTMPVYCVPGNHDVNLPADAAASKRFRDQIGPDFFSFEHHGWTFIGINSQAFAPAHNDEPNAQHEWLRQTLVATQAAKRPVILFGHIPPFTATPDEPAEYYNWPLPRRTEFLKLCRENHVVAVLSGHIHGQAQTTLDGTLFFCGAATSTNFDKSPRGFTLWTVGSGRTAQPTRIPLVLPATAPE